MTAEIAVLNKTAVVLAADSAVTIGRGGGAKIFNSANKIFEIGTCNPIGLMIYNRLDFMGLPLEVLAKEFRRQRSKTVYRSVEECCDDFMSFLFHEVPRTTADEAENLRMICADVLEGLWHKFERALREDIETTGKVLKSRFNNILKGVLDAEIDALKSRPKAEGFSSVVLSKPDKDIVDALASTFIQGFKINSTCHRLIYRLISLSIERADLSGFRTGLVFAGFGEDDLCPTLIHLCTDGVLSGKLKTVTVQTVDIGRNGSPADVLGFAQDDMVQSFVNGVDPFFRNFNRRLLRQAVQASAELVLTPIIRDQSKTQTVLDGLSQQFDDLTSQLDRSADDWVERTFTQDVKDMVRSMPKEELANLAESLIEITSLKRKVTRDRETVGGDVDVAVISRSEGLIWVKRKHYFPPELNSRFFERRRGKDHDHQ